MFRGLAALAVTWFHLTNTYDSGIVQLSGSTGWLGVDSFFVISGFIIPYSLHQQRYALPSLPRFLSRRMIRIEPPYLASIFLVIALNLASSALPGFRGQRIDYSAGQILSHLLYLAPIFNQPWINVVYWSLAYEFAFYIAAGVLFPFLWPRNLAYTVATALVFLLAKFFLTGSWDSYIVLFLLGVSAARYFVRQDGLWQFIACVAGSSVALVMSGQAPIAAVGALTALALVFIRLPRWNPLIWLGTISYSLYLVHVPIGGRVVNLGRRFMSGEPQQLALSVLGLIASLMAAAAFYFLIERPSTRLSRMVVLRPAPVSGRSDSL